MLVHGLVLSALALAAPQDAPPHFRCTILQSSGGFGATASDINARGEAVGCVLSPAGLLVAAHWSPTGALTVLGDPTAPIASAAAAINDDGAIVGSRGLWKKPQPMRWSLVDGGHLIAGPRPSAAVDVSSRGDVLFHVPTATGAAGLLRERDGGWMRIESPPLTLVAGLSNDRNVAGTHLVGNSGLAFRWSKSSGIEDLPLPPGFIESSANGISEDDSQVVGWAIDAAGVHALTWDALGPPHVLSYGALQTTDARAIDINASDWVVGTHVGFLAGGLSRLYGTLWANGGVHELESLIQAGPLVEVRIATDINDKGQIVATAMANGQPCLVRLDPL